MQHSAPMPILPRDTPKKHSIADEEVVYLGDYYFSKVHWDVLRKTPKKSKMDESGKDVVVSEEPKTM